MLDDTDDLRRRLASPALVASLLGLAADPVEMAQRKRRASSRVMVLCPSHGERTASCSLTVGGDGTLAVHCFSAGGRCLDGDVFTLIAAVYRLDAFKDVLAEARRLAGVSPYTAVRARPPPPPPPPISEPPRLADADFDALLAPLLAGATVRRQPDVAAYLSRRLLLAEAEADGWAALPPAPEQARWIAHLCATAPGGREAVARSGLVPLDAETDEPLFHRFAQLLVGKELHLAVDGQLHVAAIHRRHGLAHAFDHAAEHGFPLTLSGHTHGGQVMLTADTGAGPAMFRYWSGLYQKAGRALVVSNGTGNWFPLRLNAPAEIIKITLRQA